MESNKVQLQLRRVGAEQPRPSRERITQSHSSRFELHQSEEIELGPTPGQVNLVTDERGITNESSLPPVDTGRAAWLVLLGSFVLESLVWGLGSSFGVFQEYYSSLEYFHGQETRVPVVGTVGSGILYLCSPIALALYRRFPHRRRQGMLVGLCMTCAALVGASFATDVNQLIWTQGVLWAVGGSVLYYPVFFFIDEWFVRRKAFAFGVVWAASAFGGLVLPYLLAWTLQQYSFRGTLRILAVTSFILMAPVLPFLKHRVPLPANTHYQRPSLRFAAEPLFLAYWMGGLIQNLGYFMPGLYLPSYARDLGFSKIIATSSLSLLNVGAFVGYLVGGWLTDRYSIKTVIIVSTLGTTATITSMWGLSSSAALVILFALLYGFFTAVFTSTWPGIVGAVMRRNSTQNVEATTVYTFFVMGKGIGGLVSGPLSQALLHLPRLTDSFLYGYGSLYGSLMVFTAVSTFFGALGPAAESLGVM